ncbi:Protein of unknown function (DUF1822) [Rivularia sp. PCC 7116]|uniref:DUF1822 family protein n=1 Tax=Rivularia sp. PCC 7116 TaxID=373994 RepID=UPI00029F25BA|nr:DUF1822 family protein [Rivularia sp. PCC 7116]AFY57537.1 Protein of unknown function (DUF1822) [Rivularia sp. PCC 7116]
MPNSTYSQGLRLLLPETVWLEPEHFVLANEINYPHTISGKDNWQGYLNRLALIALEVWLQIRLADEDMRLTNKVILKDTSTIKTAGILRVDNFKFCAIATENLLDEIVNIPQELIEKPELTAHFYVIIEILESQEEVIIKGFLTYKQLIEIKSSLKLSISQGCYQLPLSVFDSEPNHLLLYKRYIQASEFALPVVETQATRISNLSGIVTTTTTKLSELKFRF